MDKLTKIVATIGPTSDSEDTVEELIHAGVNLFRFNFKHNIISWHNERIRRVNKVSKRLNKPVGTLIDLQGPEIRINMPQDELIIRENDLLVFGEDVYKQSSKGFSISHPQIIKHLKEGQKIVADSGSFSFTFEKNGEKTYLRSHSNGVLKNRKALNIPGADFPFPVLVDRDFEGLKLAERNEIDFVALSFVRSPEDILVVREEMKKYHVEAKLIAKIETEKALKHLDEIIEISDGIMVARGDLGVELPIEEVPYHQKIIIKKSIKKGIPVITATQMLESMIEKPFPTRAEISDIANATYDLTDAVMLSGETATGKYPVEAVRVMSKTVAFNERKNMVDSRKRFDFQKEDQDAIMCDTAYGLYLEYRKRKEHIAGFLAFTHTGKTIRLLSRYRPLIPIFAFDPQDKISESLTLQYGVIPFCFKQIGKKTRVNKEDIIKAVAYLKKQKLTKRGDILIVLHGEYWASQGQTSTVKILKVE
ncbi:pyruvate kinase [Candidatus Roizmanbacteria bacterium RIFOXYB2_FULL_38_10]|uniref:Pyruvate kinase n=1 Tax=Candidatus Roizmanbacteria bacterium RIFOXYD1_FULL_38_12 TaxID=1802093 RepID=A0A1F7L0W8_9BACT|nr:MAG: pyruvate kinase [Candidatus Roizmanbacteria bacterium RIFOXYA2_FULL_38_14]OGK63723.1 MAG: pyruvate kinase [Candidatus Roizmanbacteria bacterium RIFOXYA1_FULL_37_12]OGK65569.1 MAG: pyruvate kinase [Candidatus Roizmanbacteria bacterium RIFOXYB1_FULL_40_23]OGK68353.1 MAG: pyruvate kinase [Candidatus Roizmanbacteria bacterium RIFOXYB2_FULL_38_10]OGK69974.1 MAG: pyruvate kinase [Candidatus Roizmanbacteria bacterium RIFOXYC1_FULL_38_14]OGK72465.1 MAG: pyruvate kinase [Candidatus Roizmanbacte